MNTAKCFLCEISGTTWSALEQDLRHINLVIICCKKKWSRFSRFIEISVYLVQQIQTRRVSDLFTLLIRLLKVLTLISPTQNYGLRECQFLLNINERAGDCGFEHSTQYTVGHILFEPMKPIVLSDSRCKFSYSYKIYFSQKK